MIKCGNKFCSDPSVKSEDAVHECVTTIQANHPEWKGSCFYQRPSAGCEECGSRVIMASGCSHCIECGASRCS